MPKFRVNGTVIAGKYLGCFEAATEEAAIEKAINENWHVSLCHHCSDECIDPQIEDATAEKVED